MISPMSDRGGNDNDMTDGDESAGETGGIRRSRLLDYAEMGGAEPPAAPVAASEPLTSDDDVARRRHEFAVLLGEFRRTAVLVPTDEDDAPLVGDFGGIRWIYAFSNESALARFAIARGEGGREWPYQRPLGARLLEAGREERAKADVVKREDDAKKPEHPPRRLRPEPLVRTSQARRARLRGALSL